MSNEKSRFHWGEANKYGVEAFKSAFLLNSGLAIAVVGYMAKDQTSRCLIFAMASFLAAALASSIAMAMAWYSSLSYGNAVNKEPTDDAIWARGDRWAKFAAFMLVPIILSHLGGWALAV